MLENHQIPLKARICLSHAYFQRFCDRNKIDALHIKGYAFGSDCYPAHRVSTDVDLLVRPAHIERLIYLLRKDGWSLQAHFETGSIFEHAATLYHPAWGLTDIHRSFPGLGKDPALAFDQLWEKRASKEIAHYSCLVPQLSDMRMLVVLHTAKDKSHYMPDIVHLRETLSAEDWQKVEERVVETDSEIAYATALGRLEDFRGQPDYLLWKSVSQDVPEYVQWIARLQQAHGLRPKVQTLQKIFMVNRDHLAMELGHDPSKREIRDKFFSRFTSLLARKG